MTAKLPKKDQCGHLFCFTFSTNGFCQVKWRVLVDSVVPSWSKPRWIECGKARSSNKPVDWNGTDGSRQSSQSSSLKRNKF